MADGLLLLHATHTFPQYQCEKVNMITGRGPENTFLLPNCPTCSTFFWHGKTFPSVTPYWIKTNACSRYLHAKSVNPLSEMLLEPVTPPRWQDYGLRFHTDSGRKDESQGHLSCLWVVLSLRGTGNVSCDIWPHHRELLAPFWEDTGFITASVPTPSDATPSRTCESAPGELRQAACAGQKS